MSSVGPKMQRNCQHQTKEVSYNHTQTRWRTNPLCFLLCAQVSGHAGRPFNCMLCRYRYEALYAWFNSLLAGCGLELFIHRYKILLSKQQSMASNTGQSNCPKCLSCKSKLLSASHLLSHLCARPNEQLFSQPYNAPKITMVKKLLPNQAQLQLASVSACPQSSRKLIFFFHIIAVAIQLHIAIWVLGQLCLW